MPSHVSLPFHSPTSNTCPKATPLVHHLRVCQHVQVAWSSKGVLKREKNVSVKAIYLKYYWSKYRSMQNNSLWTFSFVVVKGLLRTEFLVAVGTRIHKKVGEVNCFNVILHTCGCFVRKFEANSTSGYVFIISDQEFQQVIWILDVSWINTKRLTWF